MRNVMVLIAVLLSMPIAAIENNIREMDFNQNWKFKLDDQGNFKSKTLDDSHWQKVRLPHDWSILEDFNEKYDGATGYSPGGIAWYRKSFKTNFDANKQLQYLYFDGIYNHSEIWLNGQKVGGRISGYTPFYYDISSYLAPSGEENHLAIRVDRSRYIDSRWYTGSGIYRDVKLITTNKLHIPIWGTYITTPSITRDAATLKLKVAVSNQFTENRRFEIDTDIISGNGEIVTTHRTKGTLQGKTEKTIDMQLQLTSPELWSPEAPNLYTAKTTIKVNGSPVDQLETRFGVRTIEYDAARGFFLNGVSTAIKGVNLHHDAGAVGVAVPDDVWKRRFKKLKEAGVNAIRTAHNPMSTRFMDLCDEMGFLVQAEIFDEWDNPKDKRLNQWERHDDYASRGYANYFQEEAEGDLYNAVKRDRNHPAIVMWSIGNEIEWTYPRYKAATGYFDMNASGNYFHNPPFISPQEIVSRFHKSDEGKYVLANTAQKLSQWLKALDTTRPVTANLILPSVSHISGYTDALDIVGYSYRRVIYDYGHELFPEKMIMGTENVAHWHEWKAIEERDFIPGTFLWTGIDYLGEAHNQWPNKGFNGGLIDVAGFAHPSFHLYKSLWNSEPHLKITAQTEEQSVYQRDEKGNVTEKEVGKWQHRVWGWQDVNEHWNYANNEPVIIEVLSNCDSVELFLNGKTQGVQTLKNSPDHIHKWALNFEPGVLMARGTNGCSAIDTVVTAAQASQLHVETDKTNLAADVNQVAHVLVEVRDGNNTPVRHQEMQLSVENSSNLELIGADNGNSSTITNYRSKDVITEQGKALFMFRSLDGKAGVIKISGTAVEPVSVNIN
ncbi:MAG: glycoside hydrolase family 2 TIM barrel-domain containing protein [Paraglaciecola sp.]|uniref:glycoside hydrolase family 2 TIM barrel-domain containing protein n=1 Tax=Paraglaciecola sp. TaxID=1920173 RepID=UPI003297136B